MDILPERKIIRIKGFDYSRGGGYFVTICCRHGQHRFGEVVEDEKVGAPLVRARTPERRNDATWRVEYNAFGRIVIDELENMEQRFPGTMMAGHMVMPNHVHFMLINGDETGHQLSRIVRSLKSVVSNRCMVMCKNAGVWMEPLWQRNYYEHVVRDNDDFENTLRYMYENPMRWAVKHGG